MSSIVRPGGNTPASTAYTPNRATEPPRPSDPTKPRKTRRLPNAPTELTTTNPYYRWVEPITWVDGSNYGATQLNEQIINNFNEVPRLIVMLEEDWNYDDTGAANQNITGLSFPLGANENWYVIGAFVFDWNSTNTVLFTVPDGSFVAGDTSFVDYSGAGNGTDEPFTLYGSTPSDTFGQYGNLTQGYGSDNPFVQIYIMTVIGGTAGTFQPLFSGQSPGPSIVKAGSCLIGMRLSP